MNEVHTIVPTQLLATRTYGKGRREEIKCQRNKRQTLNQNE
jgi:hypothetical protein